MSRPKIASLFFAVILLAGMSFAVFRTLNANAVTGTDFQAGNIIDDYTFYHSSSMTTNQIQNFLNAKVPTCDTNGTAQKSYYYNSSTGRVNNSADTWITTSRATYGARYDAWYKTTIAAAPYTCLKNYQQKTPAMAAESGICGNLPAYTSRTAAQIISDVAAACGVNPQVLIVLIQKEQGLVTDSWPWDNQYAKATGFYCPDTAPCDPSYASFFYQVYYAAHQFRMYRANPDNYGYVAGQKNYIYYNPDHSCGGSWVTIENQATAGLYDYTPYQPNAATLKVGLGQTAPCGSYGNKNFWWYFTDWFGSTHAALVSVTPITFEDQPFTDAPTTASFTLKNVSSKTLTFYELKIAARDSNNKNVDFPAVWNISIAPGQSYTYRQTTTFNGAEGSYDFYIARYDGTKWHYPPFDDLYQLEDRDVKLTISKHPSLTQSLSLSTTNVHANQSITATFKVVNNSTTQKVSIGYIKPAVRDSNGKNYDFPYSPYVTLDPGASYTYNASRSFDHTGNYHIWIADKRTNYPWSDVFPASDGDLTRSINISIKPQVTLTSGLSVSLPDYHANNTATATFTVKNFGDTSVDLGYIKPAVRDSNGKNYDFPYSPSLTLAAGQSYTYTETRVFDHESKYYSWITQTSDKKTWSISYPANEVPGLARDNYTTIKPQLTLTSPLKVSMPNQHATNTATATFTVTNFGTTQATVGYIKPAVRDQSNHNLDFPYSPYVTLAPGASYTYNQSRTLPAGKLHVWIANLRNNMPWSETFPASETSGMVRSTYLSVKQAATLTSPLAVSMTNPTAGNTATATFTVTNFGTTTQEIGYIKPAVRDSKNHNLDFPYSPYVKLAAGASYTYNASRILPYADTYYVWIANLRNNMPWSETFPASETSGMVRHLKWDLKKEARLISPLQVSVSGTTVTGSFTIKNFASTAIEIGYIKPAVRNSQGKNYDLPYSPYVTLQPGQTYTYNQSRALDAGSKYHFWIANKRTNFAWSETFPTSQDSSMARTYDLTLP